MQHDTGLKLDTSFSFFGNRQQAKKHGNLLNVFYKMHVIFLI